MKRRAAETNRALASIASKRSKGNDVVYHQIMPIETLNRRRGRNSRPIPGIHHVSARPAQSSLSHPLQASRPERAATLPTPLSHPEHTSRLFRFGVDDPQVIFEFECPPPSRTTKVWRQLARISLCGTHWQTDTKQLSPRVAECSANVPRYTLRE